MKMKYNKVIDAIVNSTKVVRATEYISPKLIIRAVRKLYGKKIIAKHNIEITLTIGRPNYVERKLVRDFLKAKEPFPIKGVQLKMYDPKPNTLKRK